LLQSAGTETVFNCWHGGRTDEETIRILQGIDGAVLSLDPMTDRVLRACDRLKVASRTGVGYDSIDVRTATELKIAVCTTPSPNSNAVADWTMAFVLQCARKLVESLAEVRRRGWARSDGHNLCAGTLGVVGLGQIGIGKEVVKRARGFGMRVLAYDVVRDSTFASQHQVEYVGLEQPLRESDYVSLHALLDASAHRLFNAERLALMKATAYLINAARGGLVDEWALVDALREKRIAGAALDAFEHEPLEADSPLRGLDNAYLLPHAAWATKESQDATGRMAAENAILVLQRKKPHYLVNPEVLG
jgi:phosphoglycerate dehydrogenase-like enzyme